MECEICLIPFKVQLPIYCKLACVRHLPQCAVLSTLTPYTPEAPIVSAYTPDICNASGEFQSSASMARLRQQDESGDHC